MGATTATTPSGRQALRLVPRERLFARLDELAKRRIVWIAGPAGAGKTSLANSWLAHRDKRFAWLSVTADDADPASFVHDLADAVPTAPGAPLLPRLTIDQAADLPRFARAFVRALFEALAPPPAGTGAVLVLDNCEAIAGARALALLAEGISAAPASVTVLVLSHEPPDAAFARLEAQRALGFIGWDELRLTAAEALAVAAAVDVTDPSVAARLAERADGWVSGLVLLAERLRTFGNEGLDSAAAGVAGVFERLVGPTFDAFAPEVRAFLLRTAFLDPVTPDMANAITGRTDSASALERMVARGLFISRHAGAPATYHYHELFRRHLLERARTTFDAGEYRVIAATAALVLERSGHLAEAIERHAECGGEQDITRIVLEQADAMLAHGRGATLVAWIDRLPSERVATDPRLRLWRAMARMALDPVGASKALRDCATLCEQTGDIEGAALACAGLIQSYFLTFGNPSAMDPWIDRLARLLAAAADRLAPAVERHVCAAAWQIVLRTPGHALGRQWTQRAVDRYPLVADSEHKLQLANLALMGLYWQGGFQVGLEVLRTLEATLEWDKVSPAAAIQWRFSACAYHHLLGDTQAIFAQAEQGFALAERHALAMHGPFLHFFVALAHLMRGALPEAEASAAALTAEMGRYHARTDRYAFFVRAGIALARGDARAACELGKLAIRDEREVTHPTFLRTFRVGFAIALLEAGDPAAALAEAHTVLEFASAIGSPPVEWGGRLVAAEAHLALGEQQAAVAALARALAIGSRQGYVTPFPYWRPRAFAKLLACAIDAGVALDYARSLILRWKLQAPDSSVDAWPWPLRICALGAFEITIDEAPLTFNGKAQKRPLELLQALVAFGGVGVAESTLCDALWPDAEGDAARKSLEVATHRLRKLLGHDRSILVRAGKLSLNRELVWVDCWSFERKLERAQQAILEDSADATILEEPLRAYRGPLLAYESDAAWVLAPRARLAERFRQYAEALAVHQRAYASATGG